MSLCSHLIKQHAELNKDVLEYIQYFNGHSKSIYVSLVSSDHHPSTVPALINITPPFVPQMSLPSSSFYFHCCTTYIID